MLAIVLMRIPLIELGCFSRLNMSHLGQKGRNRTRGVMTTLGRFEVPQVLNTESDFPVALDRAQGARVRDVDGNRYIDLTGFFGVALVGHRNPRVVNAVRDQIGRIVHAMGDVHPAEVKARFLRRIADFMPADDYRGLVSLNGSDAVETALKFAGAATGKPGVVAFDGAYHGMSAGALEVTHSEAFRAPFSVGLMGRASFVPFPDGAGAMADSLDRVERAFAGLTPGGHQIGAVIIEVIQGRGGIRTAPDGFFRDVADLAKKAGVLVITDEIYSGCGRTGTFLAGQDDGLVPDAVCLGKALGGGFPVSVCLMRDRMAMSVAGVRGEAAHTSTYLGHPVGMAAGLAVLRVLDSMDVAGQAGRIERAVRRHSARWAQSYGFVGPTRGRGAMMGVPIIDRDGRPDGITASAIVAKALKKGVIILTEGQSGDVLAFTPPLVISDGDLETALGAIFQAIAEVADEGVL